MAERTLMSFKIKNMKRAKTVLDVELMRLADRRAYQRHIENRRIENSVIETAEEKVRRVERVAFARELLLLNQMPIPMIAQVSKLSVEDVNSLAEGNDLDADSDD
jgi:phage terminase Nu1 subunit (DNA packaging protein)